MFGVSTRGFDHVCVCVCVPGDSFMLSAGAEDSESCENRNGAASALLHIDESDGGDKLNRQRSKSKKRAEPRQVQTGEEHSSADRCLLRVF